MELCGLKAFCLQYLRIVSAQIALFYLHWPARLGIKKGKLTNPQCANLVINSARSLSQCLILGRQAVIFFLRTLLASWRAPFLLTHLLLCISVGLEHVWNRKQDQPAPESPQGKVGRIVQALHFIHDSVAVTAEQNERNQFSILLACGFHLLHVRKNRGSLACIVGWVYKKGELPTKTCYIERLHRHFEYVHCNIVSSN